jgi:hypothetical protein
MSQQRWFPSVDQLKDPAATERAFRQLLTQHYNLQDSVASMREEMSKPITTKSSGPPPGSGPTDTQILGLRVAPVDVQTLADGAILKWDKKSGNFHFV